MGFEAFECKFEPLECKFEPFERDSKHSIFYLFFYFLFFLLWKFMHSSIGYNIAYANLKVYPKKNKNKKNKKQTSS